MNKFPDELIKKYWVAKIPKEINFIPNNIFFEDNNLLEFNTELPEPFGKRILLSRGEEYELFLKFNYAKYRASKIVTRDSIKRYLSMAAYYREVLTCHNWPMALSWAKRLKIDSLGWDEIDGECIYGLHYGIDKFDISRGCKFSTLAAFSIRTYVCRYKERTDRHKHGSLFLEDGKEKDYKPKVESKVETVRIDAKFDVDTMILNNRELSDRDKTIMTLLYGLQGESPLVLWEVGERFGITKQRVAQIRKEILEKIRKQFEQVMKEDAALSRC